MLKAIVLIGTVLFDGSLSAQQITMDWGSADRSLACPSETSRQTTLPVGISHLNDVLYSYTVDTSTQYTTTDDFSQLPKFTEAAEAGCPTTLHDVGASYTVVAQKMQNDPNINPKQADGSYSDVKLSDTLKSWAGIVSLPDYVSLGKRIADLKSCNYPDPNDQNTLKQILDGYSSLQDFQTKIDGPHTWKGNVSLSVGATNSVTVTVAENYAGQLVKTPVTAKCDIKSSVLSLSAGPLFSTIAGRDYTSVSVPSTSPSGQPTTVNELAVQDKSNLQPLLTGLLNYDIPVPYTSHNEIGLQLSSGPTFRIGGANNVSSFGYFGGVSLYLWKRLFLTPGVHVAEFADYPVGFSQNSVIPSGFGAPVPVKRWTARFGISISYRTNSISTLGQKTTTPTPTAGQTQKPATPAPPAVNGGKPNPPAQSGQPGTGTQPQVGSHGSTGTGAPVTPPSNPPSGAGAPPNQ